MSFYSDSIVQSQLPGNLFDGSKARHFVGGYLQLALSCSVLFSIGAEPYQHFLDYLSVYALALPLGFIVAAILLLPTVVIAGAVMAIAADSSVRVTIRKVYVQLSPVVLLIASLGALCISILALLSAAESGQPGLTTSPTWDINNLAIHAVLASPIAIGGLVILHLVSRRRLYMFATGLCQSCGYPLDQSDTCSECGSPATPPPNA